jgi:hypothetical protein
VGTGVQGMEVEVLPASILGLGFGAREGHHQRRKEVREIVDRGQRIDEGGDSRRTEWRGDPRTAGHRWRRWLAFGPATAIGSR